MKKRKLILILLINLIIVSGCFFNANPKSELNLNIDNNETIELEKDSVDIILNQMSVEEKIGQMFIVGLEQLENSVIATNKFAIEISSSQIENLNKYNVGGVIYFAKNIDTEQNLIKYISDLQANSKYPLFIAVDEEGGNISRLGNNENISVTRFPTMQKIGSSNDEAKAYEVGSVLGKELKKLGFNLNFAPVADINTNPNNLVIGSRAFGNDADLVAKMVVEVVKGLQKQNVSATLKHFPGHGDTSNDTHFGLAVSDATIENLHDNELVPFKAGIENGADFVLTAHISLPNITNDSTPATMSKKIIKEILRDELKFDGVVISDALNMGAITEYYSTKEVVLNCIDAGVDILLIPEDFILAYDTLKELVENGEISMQRIDQSVRRIIDVKLKRKIISLD